MPPISFKNFTREEKKTIIQRSLLKLVKKKGWESLLAKDLQTI